MPALHALSAPNVGVGPHRLDPDLFEAVEIRLVSFLDFDLGFFDRDEVRVELAPNPFAPEQV